MISLHAEVQVVSRSRPGEKHRLEGRENEDAVFVTDSHPVFDALLVVADGMGGHPQPREAAEAAVGAAVRRLRSAEAVSQAEKPETVLGAALAAAEAAVRALDSRPTGRSPGTTLSIAAFRGDTLFLTHVGDGSVFLVRDGEARCLAGGEGRRDGSRPAQFLGQAPPLVPETEALRIVPGDRVLLCTDGLTRYFREMAPEVLERILGRPEADVSSVAGQLLAHSRPREYDDDTTVAVAEVTSIGTADRLQLELPVEPATLASGAVRRERPARLSLAISLLLAIPAAAAAGFLFARWTAPPTALPRVDLPPPRPPIAEGVPGIPERDLVLLDPAGGRLYLLSTGRTPAVTRPLLLRAVGLGSDGRLTEAGSFRFDPTRLELTDGAGNIFPVLHDRISGSLTLLKGGTLHVTSKPPGRPVWLDGRKVGTTPLRIQVAVGRHRVGPTPEQGREVEVTAGELRTLKWGAP